MMDNLVISGLGMISSVGRDVVTACAAIRAGMSRPHDIDDFEVIDPQTQEAIAVRGHPIKGFSDGFNLVGLWLRLARACLLDLLHFGELTASHPAFWGKAGILAVTPRIGGERFLLDEDEPIERVAKAFVAPLCKLVGLPISAERQRVAWGGQSAVISAVATARQWMNELSLDRVVILGVDSLVDSLALEWLARHNRLKCPDQPSGLAPGESCAAFLLERESACRKRRGLIHARLAGIGMGREENNFYCDAFNQGKGLAEAIRQALDEAGVDTLWHGDLVSDLNGEDWKAVELACARMQLRDRVSSLAPLVLPCISVGDVGAAAAAVQVCVAARSFDRKYATSDSSLVVTSSEDGDVGALLLRSPA